MLDACSVKRKADVNSTKTDGVWNAKQKKMEKNKSKVSQKGTVTTALREVNKSVEILSTKELTVQLDCDGKTFLEDLKKTSEETDARIIRERVPQAVFKEGADQQLNFPYHCLRDRLHFNIFIEVWPRPLQSKTNVCLRWSCLFQLEVQVGKRS